MIGENLNEKQNLVLSAIADAVEGYQYVSLSSVRRTMKSSARFNTVFSISDKDLEGVLNFLESECLIVTKTIKDETHVGLTIDGCHCLNIS